MRAHGGFKSAHAAVAAKGGTHLKAHSVHKFTTKERKSEAKTGVAMKDGSFPIRNAQDLANARQAIGRAKPGKRAAVRAHIAARAKALRS